MLRKIKSKQQGKTNHILGIVLSEGFVFPFLGFFFAISGGIYGKYILISDRAGIDKILFWVIMSFAWYRRMNCW